MTLTHRLHVTIDDQIENRYLPVAFEVPPGSDSVEVRLSYDTSAGVLDLGCEGPAGWRGWSGGARTRFVITPTAATPGYLPGELEAGTWHVILGLHQLPGVGLDVVLEVDVPATGAVETEPAAAVGQGAPRGSTRDLPAPDGLTWFAGDFHAHTLHSDGAESIDQLAARAAAAGLDFLAVTDHNTTSHHPHLPGAGARHSVNLLPGQEVTTARGHANAFGDIGWIDFRESAQRWVHEVAARGGVLSVNHAVDGDCAWQHPLTTLPRALELWHISWFRDLTASFPWAFWARWGEVVPIGGSDFHKPGQGWTLGTPTTWVAAQENTPESILAGVQAGRTSISVGVRPDATPDPLHTPMLLRLGEDLVALAAEGSVLVDIDGARRRITGPSVTVASSWGTGPYRLEDPDRRVLAICA
ncbi:CehA/McbA family metallohydrolase [Occultella gossypii]|uniref:CehA/McbA family metallohydrolase n=1 Tax=Occultella gossypii TaxID=2800820 RepID=A0ABS7S6M5_9MICO|nr:CehA/McbA family metallohydrolase [Occultella gossypii]MBZ2196005.1 CehA/McbA family metallohydrolase [Occultella gossypii]